MKILSRIRQSKDTQSSAWFMFCNILQKGIAFITVPIFTRMMSTSEYGEFSVFQSWIQIFTIFTSLNIAYGVLNKALTEFDDADHFVSCSQMLYSINTILIFGIVSVVNFGIYNFLKLPPYIVVLMFVELMIAPALAIYSVKGRFFLKYKKAVVLTILLSVLNPIVGILFVRFSLEKGIARIIAYLLVEIVICGIVYFAHFIRGGNPFSKKYFSYILKVSLPLIPLFLSSVILNQSDKIMIGNLVSEEAAAIYSVAYSIAMIMKILNESVNASFIPWLYKKIKTGDTSSIQKITNYLVIGTALANIMVILFSKEAVLLIGSQKYIDAVAIMPILTISVFLMFVISIFNNIEIYYNKNKYIAFVSILIAIINLVLNYVGITNFGFQAAAYTTAICYAISLFLHIIFVNKSIKEANGLYNGLLICVVSFFLIAISFVTPWLYGFLRVRISIGLSIFAIIYVFFKKRVFINEKQ